MFTLPLMSPSQVLCFSILMQINIKIRNILRLQQMLLIVNSTPLTTITATLLTPAQQCKADQSDYTVLQVSCTQYSCIVFGVTNLYKKKTRTRNRDKHASRLVQDSWLCVASVRKYKPLSPSSSFKYILFTTKQAHQNSIIMTPLPRKI